MDGDMMMMMNGYFVEPNDESESDFDDVDIERCEEEEVPSSPTDPTASATTTTAAMVGGGSDRETAESRPPDARILGELRDEIRLLRADVCELKRICGRMDDHITFINGTYSAVRTPMSWVFSRINRMMGIGGGASVSLPQIKDDDQQ